MKPKEIDTPVELIDIFPTLIDITGIGKDIPKCDKRYSDLCFEGKSLLPFIMDQVSYRDKYSVANIALSQYPRPSLKSKRNSDKPRLKNIKIMGYTLRTHRFRYTEWIQFNNTNFSKNWNKIYAVELYDHSSDDYESNNLNKIPAYADLISYFSKILRTKVNKSNIFY